VDRRSLVGSLAGIGLIVSSAACGPSTTPNLSKPVEACSLMSSSEAESIFALASRYRPRQQAPTDDQSYCLYPGSTGGTYLIVTVTWSQAKLSAFEKAHDGRHLTAGGTLPSGESVPATTFVKVDVDGGTAYWSARQPLPLTGTANYPSLMAATKNGYVVALSAIGLTEPQNKQILSTMLRRL